MDKKKLKDFNQVIQSQLNLPFFNVSQFDLLRIKSDPNNVYKNFNNYINGYSKNVLDIIENFQIDPLVTKLNKNKKLYLLLIFSVSPESFIVQLLLGHEHGILDPDSSLGATR